MGICSSYIAKLWGLLKSLMLVLDLRFRKVEVNAYSSEIFMNITQGRSIKSKGLEMLKKIGSLLSRFDEAFVKHGFRESKWYVNALAKVDCILNRDMHHYIVAHSFIEKLLVEDIMRDYTSMEVSV